MDIRNVPAIDIHAHYGATFFKKPQPFIELNSGDENVVLKRMDISKILCAAVSPLEAIFPTGQGNPVKANEDAAKVCKRNSKLFQWVVINPNDPRTYEQAEIMLADDKCIGIKLHPECHVYPIKRHGDKIFEFAARFNAVVLSHSGGENSNPLDFVPYADKYPNIRIIAAHIGHGWDGDVTRQVRAVQKAKHDNIYADTSSAKSILPGLIEWAVRECGSEHILFGTDTPLQYAPMHRARIETAETDEKHKTNILYRTALNLFGGALKEFYEKTTL